MSPNPPGFQAKPYGQSSISDLFGWDVILSDLVITDDLKAIRSSVAAADYFAPTRPQGYAQMPAIGHGTEKVFLDESRHESRPFPANLVAGALNVCAIEVESSHHLNLPTQLTAGPAPLQVLPSPKAQDEQDDNRFPFLERGMCGHNLHWKHLRAKRSYSYYKCEICNVHWRQVRPKVSQRMARKH
jgi:hypothetical protein